MNEMFHLFYTWFMGGEEGLRMWIMKGAFGDFVLRIAQEYELWTHSNFLNIDTTFYPGKRKNDGVGGWIICMYFEVFARFLQLYWIWIKGFLFRISVSEKSWNLHSLESIVNRQELWCDVEVDVESEDGGHQWVIEWIWNMEWIQKNIDKKIPINECTSESEEIPWSEFKF